MFGFGKKEIKESILAKGVATTIINNINEYYQNILITVKKHTDVNIDFVNDNLMKKHLMYCLISSQTLMMFDIFKDATQAERINNYLIKSFSVGQVAQGNFPLRLSQNRT